MVEEKTVKKITAGFVFSWIFGVLFLLAGVGMIGQGSFVAGIIVVLCAAMIIPYFNRLIAEKFHYEISGGIKFALVIVIFIAMGVAMANSTKSTGSVTDTTPAANPKLGDAGAALETENPKVGSVNTSAPSAPRTNPVTCPDITKTATYEFSWADSIQGNRNLYLYADFLKYVEFSGDWSIERMPSSNEYMRDSFVCEKGARAGESVNKVYCRPTISYEPRLRRNQIDTDGNIVKTDYQYIKTFVFDATGKNIENAVDLSSLKLEAITCSTSSW